MSKLIVQVPALQHQDLMHHPRKLKKYGKLNNSSRNVLIDCLAHESPSLKYFNSLLIKHFLCSISLSLRSYFPARS